MKFMNILCAVMCAIMVWGVISWVEVVANNCEPNPDYNDANFFVVMTEIFE